MALIRYIGGLSEVNLNPQTGASATGEAARAWGTAKRGVPIEAADDVARALVEQEAASWVYVESIEVNVPAPPAAAEG